MEYKYLKIPIIEVEHFYEDVIYSQIEEGPCLVTDGVTIQFWYIYVDANTSKKRSLKMYVKQKDVSDGSNTSAVKGVVVYMRKLRWKLQNK